MLDIDLAGTSVNTIYLLVFFNCYHKFAVCIVLNLINCHEECSEDLTSSTKSLHDSF